MSEQDRLVAYSSLLARATVDKAMAELPVGSLFPATVLGPPTTDSSGTMYGSVVVQLDRDLPTAVPLEVAVLTESPPVAGQRVMVQSVPPWGLFVTNYIGGTDPGVGRLGFNAGDSPQTLTLDSTLQRVLFDCPEIEDGITADTGIHGLIAQSPGVFHYDVGLSLFTDSFTTTPSVMVAHVILYDETDAWQDTVDERSFTVTGTYEVTPLALSGLCSIAEAGWYLAVELVGSDVTGVAEVQVNSHFDLAYTRRYVPRTACSGVG